MGLIRSQWGQAFPLNKTNHDDDDDEEEEEIGEEDDDADAYKWHFYELEKTDWVQ